MHKAVEERYKLITSALPNEVQRKCDALQEKIKAFYTLFKENPYNVEDYLNFSKNFQREKPKVEQLEAELDSLLEL